MLNLPRMTFSAGNSITTKTRIISFLSFLTVLLQFRFGIQLLSVESRRLHCQKDGCGDSRLRRVHSCPPPSRWNTIQRNHTPSERRLNGPQRGENPAPAIEEPLSSTLYKPASRASSVLPVLLLPELRNSASTVVVGATMGAAAAGEKGKEKEEVEVAVGTHYDVIKMTLEKESVESTFGFTVNKLQYGHIRNGCYMILDCTYFVEPVMMEVKKCRHELADENLARRQIIFEINGVRRDYEEMKNELRSKKVTLILQRQKKCFVFNRSDGDSWVLV